MLFIKIFFLSKMRGATLGRFYEERLGENVIFLSAFKTQAKD